MSQIVLLGTAFSREQIQEIRAMAEPAGYTVKDLKSSVDESALADCEILCGHCSADQLKNANKIRWIQLTSAGVDRMADPTIYPHDDVVLTNATGVFGVSIAEHLIMGTLMLLRKMPHYMARQREKAWQRAEGLRFLCGSRVTILGTGDLGGTFARYCAALGAHPAGVSRTGAQKEPFERVFPSDQIAEAVKDADIVAACLPGTRATEGIVSAEVIAAMKPGVLFLNAGRGSTVDEDALIRILREPKNALCKQYEALLEMDGIRLTFQEEAVREIARQAIARKCGARGLRAIIEDCMLDTMFELPGMTDVSECVITLDSVTGGKPELIREAPKRINRRAEPKTSKTDAS